MEGAISPGGSVSFTSSDATVGGVPDAVTTISNTAFCVVVACGRDGEQRQQSQRALQKNLLLPRSVCRHRRPRSGRRCDAHADAAQHDDADRRPEPPALPHARRLPRLARRRLDDHQRMAPAPRPRSRGGSTAHGLQLGDLRIDLGAIERVRASRRGTDCNRTAPGRSRPSPGSTRRCRTANARPPSARTRGGTPRPLLRSARVDTGDAPGPPSTATRVSVSDVGADVGPVPGAGDLPALGRGRLGRLRTRIAVGCDAIGRRASIGRQASAAVSAEVRRRVKKPKLSTGIYLGILERFRL